MMTSSYRRQLSFILIVTFLTFTSSSVNATSDFELPVSDPSECKDPNAIWCDEFDFPLNKSIWRYDIGNNGGWGNFEQQSYTTDNVYVDDGYLHIRVVNGDRGYKSSRINTKDTVTFQYVTIEASIKVPDLSGGLWPAFWLLGTSYPDQKGWPECGEIDIAEWGARVAVESNTLHTQVLSAVHYELLELHQNEFSTLIINSTLEPNFKDDFHVYKVDWTPKYVRMFVDNRLVFAKDISNCDLIDQDCTELHDPHYLILNVAVGGTFTGIFNPTTEGGEMLVDWIRVYESSEYGTEVGPPVTVTPCDGPCPINEGDSGATTVRAAGTFWMAAMFVMYSMLVA